MRKAELWIPQLLTLAGPLLVFATDGPPLPVILAAIGLVAAGIAAGRLVAHRNATRLAAARQEADGEIARLTQLYARCVPIWVRQLETVRGEANNEVAQLARIFGEITDKLDRAIGPSRLAHSAAGSVHEDIVDELARNGRELETLVGALRDLQSSQKRIVEEIGAEAVCLKDNASDIRRIALNVRVVSLNATVEAARAGDAGKPFAVIVADMRELAARTVEASEMFSRHAERLYGMVDAAFQEQAQTDSRIVSIAGAEVQKVVASSEAAMQRLNHAIAAMEEERRDVREDISQVLVSLQFQDRVSQILSHVTRNLEEMQGYIGNDPQEAVDERQWLERMARDYSTHEEFENRSGTRSATVQPDGAVTFF